MPVRAARGAAAGVLVAALAVGLVGCLAGSVLLSRSVGQASLDVPVVSWDEPAAPEAPAEPAEDAADPAGQPVAEQPAAQQPVEPPAEQFAQPADQPPAILDDGTAVAAVGEMLYALKQDDGPAARARATARFRSEDDWFFTPAGGALIQFEVRDVPGCRAVGGRRDGAMELRTTGDPLLRDRRGRRGAGRRRRVPAVAAPEGPGGASEERFR